MYANFLKKYRQKRFPKYLLPLIGFLALCWFLIRVIPKPSRINYPCQRAAFPLASGFLAWLFSLLLGLSLIRRSKKLRENGKYYKLVFVLLTAFTLLAILPFIPANQSRAFQPLAEPFIPTDPPNTPSGIARGIYPGRVVWVFEPLATKWNGTGSWWTDESTDPIVVKEMLSNALMKLSGTSGDEKAWEAFFKWFRQKNSLPGEFYIPGEKIAVKLNMNTTGSQGYYSNTTNTSPQIALALAEQLVNFAHVPDSCISFFDISRYISASVYEPIHAAFPGIKFVDSKGGNGRIKYLPDYDCPLVWSQALSIENGGGNPTFLPDVVSEADYIINLGSLKGHDLAGVTICAKNHVGSIYSYSSSVPSHTSPKAAGFHPYATVHDFHISSHWNFDMRPMASYNTLVDLMGHKDLGEKTLLFLVDGLYATPAQYSSISLSSKWQSLPFNNGWTASIFASLDGVAIESVGLDFLRSEPSMVHVYGNVDNYLHEAATASSPPSSVFYDPEGDGSRLNSLGVHEHWNNPESKKYTRNLGNGEGIELLPMKLYGIDANPPSGFGGVPDYENQLVFLYWSLPAGNEEKWVIERSENDTNDFRELACLDSDEYFYNDRDIFPGTVYFYRIMGRVFFGDSEPSPVIMVKLATTVRQETLKIKVYPNPVNDKLNVECTGNTNLELIDMSGAKVMAGFIPEGTHRFVWNMQHLPSGTYLLISKQGGKKEIRKIVKTDY